MTARILDLSADQYHADQIGDTPTLSASIANVLLNQSPAHAYAKHPKLNPNYERKQEEKFEVGLAAHRLLLEGENAIEVIVADNFRTQVARDHRDEARAHGRVPLLAVDADRVIELAAAIRVRVDALNLNPVPFTDGQSEVTVVWDEGDVACRARLDWLRDDKCAIDDLKTTTRSASPESFSRTLYTMGYHVQARFYQRAIAAITGKMPDFRFVVVETAAPFAVTVFSLAPAGEALADTQIEWALATWKRCVDTGRWPSYPNRICYAEPPGWAEAQWLEREYREEIAA